MKGITLCAECAYYDLKKHKCNLGATIDPDLSKGKDVRFYVDCPLDDVEPVRHGLRTAAREQRDEINAEIIQIVRAMAAALDTGEAPALRMNAVDETVDETTEDALTGEG